MEGDEAAEVVERKDPPLPPPLIDYPPPPEQEQAINSEHPPPPSVDLAPDQRIDKRGYRYPIDPRTGKRDTSKRIPPGWTEEEYDQLSKY